MWEFGYTSWIPEDSSKVSEDDPVVRFDRLWGEASTFAEALRTLCENVEKMASDANEDDMGHFSSVLVEIRTIRDDIGIMSDPDQWEDMEFTDQYGDIEYFVIQS